MSLIELHKTRLQLDDAIQTAAFLNRDELVLMTSQGEVFIYQIKAQALRKILETNPAEAVGRSDGRCFDPTAQTSIYTMDSFIVIVNDYKTHGIVFSLKEDLRIDLYRGDYYAEHSQYPIALFKDPADSPCLIYAAAWNKLHIANLETRQVLTAAKSLIEENAEQRYNKESRFWPSEYDYFFGKLSLSPDQKSFISAGYGALVIATSTTILKTLSKIHVLKT